MDDYGGWWVWEGGAGINASIWTGGGHGQGVYHRYLSSIGGGEECYYGRGDGPHYVSGVKSGDGKVFFSVMSYREG